MKSSQSYEEFIKIKDFDWTSFEITSLCLKAHNHDNAKGKIMTKGKVYSQDGLDEAVDKYLGGMKLRAVCKAYPNVPKRTITCLVKNKK